MSMLIYLEFPLVQAQTDWQISFALLSSNFSLNFIIERQRPDQTRPRFGGVFQGWALSYLALNTQEYSHSV